MLMVEQKDFLSALPYGILRTRFQCEDFLILIRITLRCDNSGVRPANSGQYANNGGAPLKLGSHSKISGYDALNSGATRFKVRAPYCEIFAAHLCIFGKPKS